MDASVEDPIKKYGPQGVEVAALIERAKTTTGDEKEAVAAVRLPVTDAVHVAIAEAAWPTMADALDAVVYDFYFDVGYDVGETDEYITWFAARCAAVALVVRDLIRTENYDAMTRPWREVIGKIHPDDPCMMKPDTGATKGER